MNCYIMTWEAHYEGKPSVAVDRQDLLDFLDTLPSVVNWRASTGAVFLVSQEHANSIADQIHKKFPKLRFLVGKIGSADCQGWTEQITWDFIRKPRPVGAK